jgi:protein SCO1/2
MRVFPILALPLALSLALASCGPESAGPKATAECLNRSSAQIGGPFRLTDTRGQTVTEKDLAGRKSLVFFGYTYCPDICPLTMFRLGSAISLMPDPAKAPRTVFISVDPARDTPEALQQYVESNGFPKDVMALTGSEEDLQAAAKTFGPTFQKEEPAAGASGYLVSHNSLVFLMDETWKLATFFRPDETPDAIAACLAAIG